MSNTHPGFKAVADKISNQQGVSQGAADAILANASRNASPQAKKQNPHLDKVAGMKKAIKDRMKNNHG